MKFLLKGMLAETVAPICYGCTE